MKNLHHERVIDGVRMRLSATVIADKWIAFCIYEQIDTLSWRDLRYIISVIK
ncbi:hypothetical protein [Vibrio parahaemolyticus]|uniref:hypothetical protein n=1 Tax=Vibrio parahaemolyticus TaxID=670 RepID=UPI0006A2E302|nr:hypothetical protein [Vibrio parahaemolyticus]AKU57667.1 hypothetical protein FORC8_4107 [Vibrio parahaemolyticus]MDF5172502.1 hypothetical protein [Vibrio parahaemolyticus]MDF5375078.1 hypothetical protein [Vibrio parahaemolyticus]MDF5429083.1 hypothetical protein [Vibrio parahaemolyticus]MDF5615416.1 hypothetical protein [Vibrio parahaemolyticus]